MAVLDIQITNALPHLKETGESVAPDRLYTNPLIRQFMGRCKQKDVQWAILFDRYGIYQSDDGHAWYCLTHATTTANLLNEKIDSC